MIVRIAHSVNDLDAILHGARAFAAFVNVPYLMGDNLEASIAAVVNNPDVRVLLAVKDGEVVGGMGLYFAPYMWDHKKVVCNELFWWCYPHAPKLAALILLKRARTLARDYGANLVSFTAMRNSPDGVGRVYERMGLKAVQTHYMGEI